MSPTNVNGDVVNKIRHIPLSYNNADSQTSALRLVLTLFPEWEHENGTVEFIRFTDGITNTVLFSLVLEPYLQFANTANTLES